MSVRGLWGLPHRAESMSEEELRAFSWVGSYSSFESPRTGNERGYSRVEWELAHDRRKLQWVEEKILTGACIAGEQCVVLHRNNINTYWCVQACRECKYIHR